LHQAFESACLFDNGPGLTDRKNSLRKLHDAAHCLTGCCGGPGARPQRKKMPANGSRALKFISPAGRAQPFSALNDQALA
jgi:hypothetical protein